MRKTRYALSRWDAAAHVHDGGWAFPDPDLTLQAMQVTVLIDAVAPVYANSPRNSVSWWMVMGMHWLLEVAGLNVRAGPAGIMYIDD